MTELAIRTETGYPTIHELLARVMADVTFVGKDGRNTQQNFNFRGIDAVLNAVGPAFRTHGVVPKPTVKTVAYENITVGEKRTPMTRCTVKVRYRFTGPAGDYEDVTVPGEAFDSGDKGTAKAMSVAYRIALIQLLALPTTEPDPDESSYERAPAAVTDQRWLAEVRQRITAATDHDALNVIGADIGIQADAGRLSLSDGTVLRAEFDTRWAAVTRPAPVAPADDQWSTPPAAPAAPAPAAAAAMPSKNQLANLAIEFDKRGITDRAERLGRTGQLLDREVPSFSTLTLDEYRTVKSALRGGWPHIDPAPGVLPDLPDGFEDNPVRDILVANIGAATSPATLDEAGQDVAQELTRGGITPAEGKYVRAVWTARKAQLQAAQQPAAARPPVGSPDNPGIADYQQRMLDGVAARQQHTPAAMVGLAQKHIRADIEDLDQLSKDEADRFLRMLTTGEKPAMAGAAR